MSPVLHLSVYCQHVSISCLANDTDTHSEREDEQEGGLFLSFPSITPFCVSSLSNVEIMHWSQKICVLVAECADGVFEE
jgi:hypothetical protein